VSDGLQSAREPNLALTEVVFRALTNLRRKTFRSGMGRKKRLCDGLRVRYEKRADLHEVFLSLACALICWSAIESGAGGLSKPLFGK
jgi:hypothetical protein